MQTPFFSRVAVALCAVTFSGSALAQSEDAPVYQFKTLADLTATEVKDQCQTGTCWSFSTTSFLESEVARISGKVIDLSEMASVRHTYPLKAEMYLRHHGLHQFGPGSLCHDVLNAVRDYGLVPEASTPGWTRARRNSTTANWTRCWPRP